MTDRLYKNIIIHKLLQKLKSRNREALTVVYVYTAALQLYMWYTLDMYI